MRERLTPGCRVGGGARKTAATTETDSGDDELVDGVVVLLGAGPGSGEEEGSEAVPFPSSEGLDVDRSGGGAGVNLRPSLSVREFRKTGGFREGDRRGSGRGEGMAAAERRGAGLGHADASALAK